jgi:lysophospholipase L1-like esterase
MKNTIAKLKNGEHVTIVATGDSVTEITFHTRGRMNWAGLLEEAIFEEYGNGICTLINTGKCGSTYEDLLTRIDRDVLRFDPDLVILSFGMNDAGHGIKGLDKFEESARHVLTKLQESSSCEILIRTPNPVVTVHGLPLPEEQPLPGKAFESERRPILEYAITLVRLAEEFNCSVVDHYRLWTEKEFNVKQPVADPIALWQRMGDAIHPGAQGHLAFFRELAPLFEVSKHFPWEEVG